jgi:hypothetical protein
MIGSPCYWAGIDSIRLARKSSTPESGARGESTFHASFILIDFLHADNDTKYCIAATYKFINPLAFHSTPIKYALDPANLLD